MRKTPILLLSTLTVSLFSSTLKVSSVIGQGTVGFSENTDILLKSGFFYLTYDELVTCGISGSDPLTYSLKQNYPNPFNPVTTIKFSLPEEQFVKITVYNILGKEVSKLVNGKLNAGRHDVLFDGSNLTSGQYFYKISAGKFTKINKMLLIK